MNTCPMNNTTTTSNKCPMMNPAFQQYREDAKKIMDTLPSLLDQKTLDVVNATAAAVVANIETITTRFYPYMFEKHPATLNYFNKSHQVKKCPLGGEASAQPFALAHAIVRYVGHLNDPEGLRASIELAAQKHCALQVKAEHYPIVYECFMWAVGQVLGDAVTAEVADAWGKVVLYIARAFIEREVEIYDHAQSVENGWFGWRDFKCVDKKRETDSIYTFTLSPADGLPVPKVESGGKYITLRMRNIPNASAEYTSRHYSISLAGDNKYSISVLMEKGEDNAPDGLVSNYLKNSLNIGDSIEVGMPFGTMTTAGVDYVNKPVVFIVGGIGCTVGLSVMQEIIAQNNYKKVYFVHCVRDGSHHSHRNKIAKLSQQSNKISSLRVYSRPRDIDTKGIDYDVGGRLNLESLTQFVPTEDINTASYYLCGPEGLVLDFVENLENKLNVERKRIQFECFGPLSKGLNAHAI